MRIAVIGGGSWGTALGHLLACNGHHVAMLVRDENLAESISSRHENPRYLPGLPLAPALVASTDASFVLEKAKIFLLAVPCQHMRETLRVLAPLVPEKAVPVCTSKGIEVSNLCCMHTVVEEELPKQAGSFAILSGPSFAQEVMTGKPTAVALGCRDEALGAMLRSVFSTPLFRVYSTSDVLGVELGGALKNVIAIAAGMSDGLDLGANGRAGLITRGIAEMSRLGNAMGAEVRTFMGLSGMGDLVLTCTGDLSRNRQLGLRMGQGEPLASICASMHNVAEGLKTADAAYSLSRKYDVEMPLTDSVKQILYDNVDPKLAVKTLMSRSLRYEWE